MCGIVGYVGRQDAVPLLIEGLQRLEYRGYDSAGVAAVKNGTLRVAKAEGKVRDLLDGLPKKVAGPIGIGHTRWATHGPPSDLNAHPHVDADEHVAVVHNGILENADSLRAELEREGVEFLSDTDTEILAHLVGRSTQPELEDKVREALRRVQGAYGIAVIDTRTPDRIVVARNGSPVVLGIGNREMLVASDVAALVKHVQQVVFLDDGEMAVLTADGFTTSTLDRKKTDKEPQEIEGDVEDYEKGGYEHYLRKEIADQPQAVAGTLRGRLDERFATAHLGGIELSARDLRTIRRVKILGCGSAYYSGIVGAELIESLARLPADAEPASEFRYRNPVIDPDTLYLAVSQSGETFDTLAAVHEVQRKGGRVLGVVNVVGSSIARACEGGIYLHAGPEVSVASTKAFNASVVAFALLALHLGRVRDLSPADGKRLITGLERLPDQIATVLEDEEVVRQAAQRFADAPSAFYIGRVRGYPIALEGAQKLKELSYVHAEAYPASELKHGPLALISPEMPTVVIAPDDHLIDKNRSAMEQIKARGGPVVAVGHSPFAGLADETLIVPKNEPELDSVLLGVPLQLLAYHASMLLGRDVDQPRNLAKSVTVE
ncbi:glutamine--fructose-6-phosphate transaminase (isomerizing) [Paraconexibacter antarcticus]|uniref:Glutamine--fructose-6-phosphate aminotransferase [isomerizing] n=1 Tax=Paraconexibacter antarcticus TaxID=2949664 RepID=A0ABY5DLT8_9ACTN|nr:glutamine--fructose-6-phosphate transaminase (isomerizing) [Paraconexibacter antarcticus]UTI62840.1 glutamine--fructose-6-phosphate transaminase (isomerizing) [Paraconexibacter antarcticus]